MIPQKVKKLIHRNKLIERYDKILVGVSGGPDSISLFHILNEIKKEYYLHLYIVHINYMLRGRESIEDEYFVKKIAQNYKTTFYLQRVVLSQKGGISLQEEARNKRYNYFIEVANQVGANKIALGHKYEDQTETIFMRLISGSGPEGIKGIPVKREIKKHLIVIRPLLDLKREEIKKYLKINNLSFRIDSSNVETKYIRNRIRLDIFPRIKKINPNFEESLRRIAYLWQEDNKYLNDLAKKHAKDIIIKENDRYVIIDNENMKQVSWCLKSRIIRLILKRFVEDINKINYNHVEDIISLVISGPNTEISLPDKVRVFRRYNELVIDKRDKERSFNYEYQVKIPGTVYIKEVNAKMEFKEKVAQNKELSKNKLEITLDYDKIKLPIRIRNRKTGDRFHPLGLKGSKKIKDFFIDKKISFCQRNKIPLVVDRKKILWVTGIEISELAKVDKDTKKILQITYQRED